MRKILLYPIGLLVMVIVSLPVAAQQKTLSFTELFGRGLPKITSTLPRITGWVDDNHYIELRTTADGESTAYAVDVKTGKATEYKGDVEVPDRRRRNEESPINVENAKNITASPDGKWVAYTKDNNLYTHELATGKTVQLTTDGSETILNGYASWVYYEEILGRGSRYCAFWWSPDSKHLAYMRFDDSKVPVFPIYWSDGSHGFLENTHYPKAGDDNPAVKVGITPADHPATIWADFNEKDDQYFGPPMWTAGGEFWVQWMNRDQNDLKVYSINLDNGTKRQVYEETQPTWIDLDEGSRIHFLDDQKTFILKSDKDGWENLYYYTLDGQPKDQITKGNFWGTSIVRVDEKQKLLYFKARKENSARFDFYRVGLDGSNLTRLSFGDYSHDQIYLSPKGKYFITVYSNLSTPPTMALVDSKGKLVRELASGKGADFDKYALAKTELVRVPSTDGKYQLPMTITYPVNFDPAKKYPVLVSIYGGPNAGTVYDRWRFNPSTQWFAQEGLIQVAVDNRASGHFGKNGLNEIYRQLGKHEIEDFMAAGSWLKQQPWVAPDKLCITGGSFGGYMTCMALTYGASVFDYGIANSSVTDWRLYDTHYTERFMDRPQDNEEGYKKTAVMTYTNQYKGLLRIIHGTADDNVHMQNTLQLIDKLENEGKHFELMIYPGERHGIGGNNRSKARHNTLEAYRFYYQYLLEKPVPQELSLD